MENDLFFQGRATQLYKAGYKTLKDIVNADPVKLVSSIDHLPRRVAYEIVAAAKVMKIRSNLMKI